MRYYLCCIYIVHSIHCPVHVFLLIYMWYCDIVILWFGQQPILNICMYVCYFVGCIQILTNSCWHVGLYILFFYLHFLLFLQQLFFFLLGVSSTIDCMRLGQYAVHGAMAGYTGFSVGLCNNRMVFLPIPILVATSPRSMNPQGRTWERILAQTRQPNTVVAKEEKK